MEKIYENNNFEKEQLIKSEKDEIPNKIFNKLKELQNSLKKESSLKSLCKKIIYLYNLKIILFSY